MRVTQHVPNFIEVGGVSPKEVECETIEEILQIPWVNGYVIMREDFIRFSKSKYYHPSDLLRQDLRTLLMAEYKVGSRVAAYLSEDVDLPTWEEGK